MAFSGIGIVRADVRKGGQRPVEPVHPLADQLDGHHANVRIRVMCQESLGRRQNIGRPHI